MDSWPLCLVVFPKMAFMGIEPKGGVGMVDGTAEPAHRTGLCEDSSGGPVDDCFCMSDAHVSPGASPAPGEDSIRVENETAPSLQVQMEDRLDGLGVPWRLVPHPRIETVRQGLDKGLPALLGLKDSDLSKCLLLEDAGGKLVLLVVRAAVHPDLKEVRRLVGCRRLHLASPERLEETLGSEPGRVSLFDLIGHRDAVSCLVLDRALATGPGDTAMPADSHRASICLPKSALEGVARRLCPQVYFLEWVC